jgi:hypothetical protein
MPVNYSAVLFTAMLHLSKAESLSGDPARATWLSTNPASSFISRTAF